MTLRNAFADLGTEPTLAAVRDKVLTDAQLRASRVPVETGLTQPLTDAQLRATRVPVETGLAPLTDTQLRATRVPVDTGLVIPQPQTDALTNAQLRASRVPVETGLVTQTDALTNAQLRAAPVSVAEDRFTRVLKFKPIAGEELRRDETATDDYHGIAADGSLTSAAVWDVVRFYKDASGKTTRTRYRTGVVWNNRTAGWT